MDNELTEQDIYTAFGIEPTEEPAVDPAGQGGEFPGSANETSPSSDELTETSRDSASDGDAAEPKAEPEEEPEKKAELSTEERRANAARRREKERKDAIAAAVAAERDRIYREMGYKDAADYRAQRAEEQANLRERAMKRMGLTAEEGEALFGPAVDPAAGVGREENPQEYSPQADIPQTGRPEADLSEEPFEGGEEALARQIAEISKLDPSIKSLADLQAKPWAAEMAQALNARQFGTDENRLLRAYKVFAQEDIIQARLADARKAGRQEALNQQAGKEHLAPAKERAGQGLPDIPKATLAAYKQLMPDLTYEQYQKEYAKTLKATK